MTTSEIHIQVLNLTMPGLEQEEKSEQRTGGRKRGRIVDDCGNLVVAAVPVPVVRDLNLDV